MTSRDELERAQRLRERFLDDARDEPLADYWRDARDLAAYDATLGQRIRWKWHAVLAECRDRGFARADDELVLDYGCGSGIAARAFVAAFGAREVRCHDRSPRAMAFACSRLRELPGAPISVQAASVASERPDVLLVSHVLGELDAAGEAELRELMRRSKRVLIVEPGNRRVSRGLSALRDSLLAQFHVVAPCPHQSACPALLRDDDWCHFFATPPPEVFTDGDQVRTWKALGIDARALPYAFLALVQHEGAAAPPPSEPRVVGRPQALPHTIRAQLCQPGGLVGVELQKRKQPELWKLVKKHPETVRTLPLQ